MFPFVSVDDKTLPTILRSHAVNNSSAFTEYAVIAPANVELAPVSSPVTVSVEDAVSAPTTATLPVPFGLRLMSPFVFVDDKVLPRILRLAALNSVPASSQYPLTFPSVESTTRVSQFN